MEEKLYKISAYLNEEEWRQFNLWVKARGITQSGFIREHLSFDVRPRGAPKGPRKNKTGQAKAMKPKNAGKGKAESSTAIPAGESAVLILGLNMEG